MSLHFVHSLLIIRCYIIFNITKAIYKSNVDDFFIISPGAERLWGTPLLKTNMGQK